MPLKPPLPLPSNPLITTGDPPLNSNTLAARSISAQTLKLPAHYLKPGLESFSGFSSYTHSSGFTNGSLLVVEENGKYVEARMLSNGGNLRTFLLFIRLYTME